MYTQAIYICPGGKTILNDQARMPHGTQTIQNIIDNFQGVAEVMQTCEYWMSMPEKIHFQAAGTTTNPVSRSHTIS
jgi:hypothetical protein